MSESRLHAYLYLIFVAIIWGVAGPVIKYTLPDFPPIIFLTYRFFISIIFFLPVFLFKKFKFPKTGRDRLILTLVALLGSTINLGLLFYGYGLTTVLDASILTSISPLMVVVASAFFLKERVTKQERVGLAIAFLGTLAIVLEPLTDHSLFALENILGNLVIIAANLAWVAYVILSKVELKHKVDPLSISFYMFVIGFLTLTPFALIQSGGFSNLVNQITSTPLRPHLGVWYMALFSGNLAYFLYQKGQKSIEASEATLFGYLSPLFAWPLAVFWLGESPTLTFAVGAAITAVGVYLAERKPKRL